MKAAATTAFVGSCTNIFGFLKPDVRRRLEAVVANPTQRTWDNAYSIIVRGEDMLSLWQAWLAVDPAAPHSKPSDAPWPRVPDQLTLYRALRHATGGKP
jgi:hypothetical protein